LRHLKALPIRSSAIDTDSAEILAKSNVDEEVSAAKDDDGSQRHFRLQRDNQSNEKQCHDEIRNELEKRQQHLIHQQRDFREHGFAQVRAVAIQEEAVRATEVATQQATTQGVVAHVRVSSDRPVREGLEGQPTDYEGEYHST